MERCEFVVARTREELVDLVKTEKPVIWDSKQELYHALDDLRDVSNNAKFKANICKNVRFGGPVEYKGNTYREISSMANFLCDLKDDDDVVFLNNNIEEALEFIQQCINIDKHPNVYLKEDVYKKKVLENIDKDYSRLIVSSQGLVDFISRLRIKPAYRKSFDQIKELTNSIASELKAFETKVIKVAVFATKKSGKSMVVNGLLGEEYAPTSLELPTPNVVKYVPVEGIERITVEYGRNSYEFNRPEDVREWIYRKFKEVELSGNRLEDMTVKYPLREGINYLIYDTPGPDLAGSQHDMINEILPDIDVAVFVIDYSKYAQESEIELFKRVKQYFEERGKKHSFICLVNKIDLMFDDPSTEKIKVRVTDFIYNKLKTLEFKEFIVIPVSAMTYFYLKKLRDRFGNELVKADDVRRYLEDKEVELDDYMYKMYKIQHVANSIRQTYMKRGVSYQDVLQFSNFESFKKYLVNITQRKAKLEKGWASVRNIEQSFNTLTTIIRNNEQLVSSQAETIRKELENFLQNYQRLYLAQVLSELDAELKAVEKEITSIVRSIFKDSKNILLKTFKDGCDTEIHKIEENLLRDASRLERGYIDRDTFVTKWSEVSIDLSKILKQSLKAFLTELEIFFEEGFGQYIKNKKEEINQRFSNIQNKLKSIFDELSRKLNEIVNNEIVNQDFTICKEYFIVPTIQLEFCFEESLVESAYSLSKMSKMVEKIQVYVSSFVFDQCIKSGPFTWFVSSLGAERYEVDEYTLKRSIVSPLVEELQKAFNHYSNTINEVFQEQADEFTDKVRDLLSQERKKAIEYIASTENSVENIKEMLKKEEYERKEIYELINQIKQNIHYKDITTTWQECCKPYQEYYEQTKKVESKEVQ